MNEQWLLLKSYKDLMVSILLLYLYKKHFDWIDLCKEAGSSINGGQSVINPWFIIGGVASAVCKKDEFIMLVTVTS